METTTDISARLPMVANIALSFALVLTIFVAVLSYFKQREAESSLAIAVGSLKACEISVVRLDAKLETYDKLFMSAKDMKMARNSMGQGGP